MMSRVLIVEDSPTQAEQIKIMLEYEGFEVALARNGIEAKDKITPFIPDIVVTDLEMPRMNGLELVEVIRRDFAETPVVLMTAFGSEEIAALALRKGAASYVPKFNLERDLVPTLNGILAVTQVDRHHYKALECLTQCESAFELDNNPALIAPIIGHLEEVLIRLKICDATERMRVGVALQEALLNAMYHGNLEVSSELRQKDEKVFYDLLEERRHQPPFEDRHVHLEVKANGEQASYVVRDEGPGFDPSVLPDPTDPSNLGNAGGRGLLLIRTFMDQVHHNQNGNEITLIKLREKRL
jgi:CheY-like chemotaxis protein